GRRGKVSRVIVRRWALPIRPLRYAPTLAKNHHAAGDARRCSSGAWGSLNAGLSLPRPAGDPCADRDVLASDPGRPRGPTFQSPGGCTERFVRR
ncbi:unnamed protein product, partial [Ixodes hexagonus]